MKRLIAVILFLMMLWTVSSSLAADLTLPVKMQRQMQHDGNGLKGSVSIHSNADPGTDPFLYTIQNAEYSILRNASGSQWHMIIFQPDEAEQQRNRTELYDNGETIYFRSDFLPDRVYNLTADALLASFLNLPKGENPSILPSLISMLSTQNSQDPWGPVLARYSKMLELWMGNYFTEPEMIRNEEGSSWMRISYLVPYDDVCKEIASLIISAADDPEVTALLRTVLSEDEINLYLNPYMGAFYEEALKSLHLTGDIRFEKTVTALGDMISSEISIPLSPEMTGFSTLSIASRDHMTFITFSGEGEAVALAFPENAEELMAGEEYELTAYVTRCMNDSENFAYAVRISRTTEKSYEEETSKEHEIHRYAVSMERDTDHLPETITEDMIPPLDPVSMDIELHYSGKTGPNAPTTLNISATVVRGELNINIEGKIKTASTWPFVPFSIDQAVTLFSFKDEAVSGYIREWMSNAGTGLVRLEDGVENGIQTVEGE